MTEGEWWRSFFSGLAVDFWLQVAGEEQTRSEVDFLERVLQLIPQARILDVPCGGGRHAVELASRGFNVTGVDLSLEFLDDARRLASERDVRVSWVHKEMRDLAGAGPFDGSYCVGNSFGYLDDPGNAEFLQAVAQVLRPGARLVIDTDLVAELLLPTFQERRWYEFGDVLCLIRHRYNHVLGRLETEYTFVRDGHVERRKAFLRVYSYSELCRLLERAGFGGFESFGSLEQEPFKLGAPRLLLVATRGE
jgi:SAM-dependent methyltransferase